MYSDAELEGLMMGSEFDLVEFKESAQDTEYIRRIVCAFANDLPANDRPGILLIGVRDDGSCASLPIDDALLDRLAAIRGEGDIQPLPSVEVQRRTLHGCEVAVVAVTPVHAPPVRYRGRSWVRVGASLRVASAEDEHRLSERRRSADLPFDHRVMNEAVPEDLDLEYVCTHYLPAAVNPDVLECNHRPREQQLAALRLLRSGRPTWGALLAFGRDPQVFLPGAYVQFLRLDGADLEETAILSRKELTGQLSDVLRGLKDLLELHVSQSARVGGVAQEIRQQDYPLEALYQLSYNAVMHRSYEGTNAPVRIHWFKERIEIISPGGLYGQVTCENFGTGSTDYRNPLVAEIMCNLGYAQRFGYGVPRARKALRENGNPDAEFSFEPNLVRVTLRSAL